MNKRKSYTESPQASWQVKPHSEQRTTLRKSHPQFFPKPRPEIQKLDLHQLDEIDTQRGGTKSEKKGRIRPTVERIKQLENELRETKAINQKSKTIWMTTLKSDVDRVEHLKLEVARMTQEKQDMQRQFEERIAAAIKETSGRESNTKQKTRQATHGGS